MIPETLRQFLFHHIDSVEQIEVLLYLRARGSDAATSLVTADEISRELRSSTSSVLQRLSALVVIEVVAVVVDDATRFRYSPKSQELVELVNLLADEYKIRRHKVLEIVFSTSKRARTFANAFVVSRGTRRDDGPESKEGEDD